MKWRGRRLSLTDEQLKEALEIRERIKAIPTLTELAKRWRCSRETARKYVYADMPKRALAARETNEPAES